MSETNRPKKPASLAQRTATGLGLVAGLLVLLAVRGWPVIIAAIVCIGLAVYEELRALARKHRPVWWPAFAALTAVPLIATQPHEGALSVLLLCCFALTLCVMLRRQPELTDILVSALPVLTVVMPGLCLAGLLRTQPEAMQVYLLVMVFTASVGCDTAAYLVGSTVGGPKLCPAISPNKTVSGAIGGLAGSVVLTLLADIVIGWIFPDFAVFPPMWANALAALAAGIASQMGDLFASMVKRHCGVKDFGHLFPGHGGMLDRMDSILFAAIVIYCYRVILLGIG